MRIFAPYANDRQLIVDIGPGAQVWLDRNLIPGTVVDMSTPEYRFVRIWITEDQVYAAHLFGHDNAWPHHVVVWNRQQLIDNGTGDPVSQLEIHAFLAAGNGIPPAPKS